MAREDRLFIDYKAAEHYTLQLAEKLRGVLGDEIQQFRFAAIPRGGMIVLGLLSYCLELTHEQCHGGLEKSRRPIVVVDDCCLSGAVFARFIERLDSDEIVFAHLFSHPKVRAAILKEESRVTACLAAENLAEREDYKSREMPAIYKEKLPGRRFWEGVPQPIAFAWSEPDGVLWNEKTEMLETNWHRANPGQCLDTRIALGIPVRGLPADRITVPENIVWKLDGDTVTLWDSGIDKVYTLEGTSGTMWRAVAAYGEKETAYDYLSTRYAADENRLKQELDAFLEKLLEKGLLKNGKK